MSQSITKEFLRALFNKYTYNPLVNLSARWAIMWCSLLMFLGIIHILFHSFYYITLSVDCTFGIIAIFLYPTLGATGTIYRNKEDTIKSYNKNLEKLVAKRTKQLSKSEEKYRTLFELVPAGMFRVSEDLEIEDINKYALNLIGLPYPEIISKRCKDIFCKSDEQASSNLSGCECQGIANKEIALTSQDGQQNFVVISCRHWEIDGKPTIIGSITNINERKKLELTILEHKSKLESIFDSMEDGIISIDKDNKIAAINKKQASILGHTPEELVGKSCVEIIHPACEEICRQVFHTGKRVRKEVVLQDKEGREIYEDIIYAPIKNKDNEVVQVIEVLRDITEKKQMENLLLRSERLASMGEIAACVAHEINNPMGIILGFTQRLVTRSPQGSLDHEELKIIEQECIRCGKIIKDLLDFARPSIPQKQLLNVEEIEKIIKNSLKLIEFQINKKGIHLHSHIENGYKIEMDPHQFQQVLINIFLNAVQAMPNGGDLAISIQRPAYHSTYPNGCGCIEIADTGVGIPEENITRVFEPFFSTKRNGTGLGLSLSKRIIDAHGGNLTLESESGKGTKITITLPL